MIVHPRMHVYQKKALKFALDKESSYSALSMGLGKTLIALCWSLNILPEVKGVLIIAPIKPMYNTWVDEKEKWTPDLSHTIIHGPGKATALRKKSDLYFTNFESIVWLYNELKRMFKQGDKIPFRAIVIDEGSMIKSHSTKRFKALRKLKDLFPKWKLVLSATPAPNSYLNLWSQYFFLDNGKRLGTTYGKYQITYFKPLDQRGFVWIAKPGACDIINEEIKDITYRLDGNDYLNLPTVTNNFIKVKLPANVRANYDKLEADFFLQLKEGSIEVFNAASLSMKLRQFVQGAVYTDTKHNYEVMHTEKLEALKSIVEAADNKPILVAIQFIFELDLISKAFPNVPIIRGGVTNSEATRLIRLWNEGKLPILLCHPKSLSHGMNMQAGSNILVWYGLPWSGEQHEQLIGRLARQGQKEEKVIVHYLLADKTIDLAIAASLKAKAKGQRGLLDYLNKYHKGEL